MRKRRSRGEYRRSSLKGEAHRVGRMAWNLDLASGRLETREQEPRADSLRPGAQQRAGDAPAQAIRQLADEVVDRRASAAGEAEDSSQARGLVGRNVECEHPVARQRLDDQHGLGTTRRLVQSHHSYRSHRPPPAQARLVFDVPN
jgi:hypothetical protein